MALPRSPFATVDKQSVIGGLVAAGSHDPDVLERERARLLSSARVGWALGGVLAAMAIAMCFMRTGILAGGPVLVLAAWLMYRGKRNTDAIKSGFAEFHKSPGF